MYFTLIYFKEWCLQPEAAKNGIPQAAQALASTFLSPPLFTGRNTHSESH